MKRANSAPESGFYRELINTDAETYGGSNVGNFGGVQTQDVPWMGREHSTLIHLPPLGTVAFKLEGDLSLSPNLDDWCVKSED
jgi:1,4-alpha-glucan branching enzyme